MKKSSLIILAVALFSGCSVFNSRAALANPTRPQDTRCFSCDDVSDLIQCRECWGYHKRSEEHKEPPLISTRCPECQGVHKFTEAHKEPRPQVCGISCPICGEEVPSMGPRHHCPHCTKVNFKPKELEIDVLDSGSYSRNREKINYVINNEDVWVRVWNKHKGLTGQEEIRCGNDERLLPTVDFSKKIVVAIFRGEYSTGGYGVSVASVVETGFDIVVTVQLQNPASGGPVTCALTQPYCIVAFQPSDLKKPVSIQVADKSANAEYTEISFQDVESGVGSSIDKREIHLVDNEKYLEELWQRHVGTCSPDSNKPAPKVDFTSDMVLAVFAGKDDDSGNGNNLSIEVIGIAIQGAVVRFNLCLTTINDMIPGVEKNCRPFTIVKFAKPAPGCDFDFHIRQTVLK